MTMRRVFAAIVDVAIVMTVYQVASAQPSTDQAVKRVIIRAGHLLDVKTGKTLNDQVIVIEGDKIVAVGPASNPQAGAGGSSIDLSTSTVLPGLIDGHTHLTGDPRNIGYQSLGLSVPREALIGARNARLTLQAGFTTVRNVAASGYSDVALRDAINAGDIPGPRMLVSGPPLSITGGHCDNNRARLARETRSPDPATCITTRLALVRRPTTSGSPTKPSLPVSPTSTLLPSLITLKTDAKPLLGNQPDWIVAPASVSRCWLRKSVSCNSGETRSHSEGGKARRISL